MSDLQNSPYFLSHEGVKGRSGKPGAGLWYRNGKLTPEGYEHYYGHAKNNPNRVSGISGTSSKKTSDNHGNSLKKVAIGVGVTAAAVGAFIAYNKSTKLRDAMRDKAREEAQMFFYSGLKNKMTGMKYHEEAVLDRYAGKTGKYMGTHKRLMDLGLDNNDKNLFNKYAKDDSRLSQAFYKSAKEDYMKYKEKDKVANTLTRIGALKTHIKGKIDAKANEKKRIQDAIDQRLKNYEREYRIRKYNKK